jgi:hypothetical protein
MSDNPSDLPGAGATPFTSDYVHSLRSEAATWRLKFREAEAQLKDANSKLVAENHELKVGQAFTETALRLGANPRLTRAILLADGHLTGLDPAKDDFIPALESLIQTAMEMEPSLKDKPASTSSGAVRAGSDITHPNTSAPLGRSVTRADVAALRAAGQHEEIAKLLKTGQLDAVMKGMA